MYNDYFGFREPPFSIAPDPRYLYMTAQHREALAHLIYGLNSEGGCILLTGEVGTGKTTICRCLLEQIPEQANVALVLNPKVSEIELLETICDELNIDYPASANSVKTYTDRIYRFLIESNSNNEKTVLIIDEAQNLSMPVLEQLRLLTNLETNQRKLLQIIILGQPELLDILSTPEMRQLAQRITARFHLRPLDREELKAYISHRLAVAGQNIQLFPDDSIRLLYRFSKGVPRLVNILCDRALLGVYVENRHSASPDIVKKAAMEVFGELKNVAPKPRKRSWRQARGHRPVYAAGIAVTLAAFMLLGFFAVQREQPRSALLDAPAPTHDQARDTERHAAGETAPAASADSTTAPLHTAPPEADDNPASGQKAVSETAQDAISGTAQDTQADPSAPSPAVQTGPPTQTDTDVVAKPQAAPETEAQDELRRFISDLDKRDKTRPGAYRRLFALWGIDKSHEPITNMCRLAGQYGLSCLYRQGNLNSLKMHDRPAVLTLFNHNGQARYATLAEIDADMATLYLNDESYRLKLEDIDRYWYGQYILLWKKPALYHAAVSPGEQNELVPWLDSQLSKITHQASFGVQRYDQALARRVKDFQQHRGLNADGIVGPLTLIHINTLTDVNLPRLLRTI